MTVASNPALRGVLLMVAAVGVFTLMDTIAKYLSRWYPVPGIVWARYAFNLVILLGWLALRGELRRMRTARPGIQLARGLLLACATLIYFTSLTVLPLADAAAIAFVLPLFVAALAVPMLKERLDLSRLAAIAVGLAGALLVVRPGSSVFTAYALLPLAMALCNALYQILTRKVAGIEHPLTSLVWGAIVGAALLSAVLPFAWKTPDQRAHWALLGVIGMLASVGHYLLIRAYDYASATLLAPYTYSGLIWAMALGFVVFGNFPDGWALAGMGVIVASGLFLVSRQRLTVHRG
ncbi:MAG TPA: DMT family transporter [Burkholderiales bacterium]|nr:DMT family transporter [Burkholderiales bacterium]